MKIAILTLDEKTIQEWLDGHPDITIISVSIDGGNVLVIYRNG